MSLKLSIWNTFQGIGLPTVRDQVRLLQSGSKRFCGTAVIDANGCRYIGLGGNQMARIHNLRNGIDQEMLNEIKEKFEEGLFPQWILTDPDIYALEVEYRFSVH